jgi:hypothetical protein
MQQALDAIPLWLFFIIICVMIAVPIEVGRRLGRGFGRVETDDKDASVGVMVGAILGLLAFMLAFTFNMAASRFEDRRQIVLREANSIATTYHRADLLPEPYATDAAALLREYVDIRVAVSRLHVTRDEIRSAIDRSEQLQLELWRIAAAAAAEAPTPITGLFVQSLNETIDIHTARVLAGVQSRIPPTIWAVLLGVSVVGLGSAAYLSGMAAKRRPVVIFGLLLSFGGVLTLIADLDRPNQGFLTTTQAPMLDVQRNMTSPP